MAARVRLRPAHWVFLVLVLAPAWKAAEWLAGTPGPKPVTAQAAELGGRLFNHEWTAKDQLASGDGLGPVFNERSCVACHNQGGIGGGGPVDKNVTVYGIPANQPNPKKLPPSGVVHQKAIRPEFQETLSYISANLPAAPCIPLKAILAGKGTQSGAQISQRNTPALFGDGLIDAVSDETIIAHQREHSHAATLVGLNGAKDNLIKGRVARLVDGRIGRFGWKGEFATLDDFVKAACANEIGLANPGRPQATPLGKPSYKQQGIDLTDAQCAMMADFIRSLPRPVELAAASPGVQSRAEAGKKLFTEIGCADCHTPNLGKVEGIYSDLLLHDMGVEMESAPGSYGQQPVPAPNFADGEPPNAAEWRTPPLWGVADSGPYLHDGRAETFDEALKAHGGEAKGVAKRYEELSANEKGALEAFLKTLHAPGASGAGTRSARSVAAR